MSRFGLTDQQIHWIQDVFAREAGANAQLKLWVFGSRARGTHRPYSDLDLLLECAPALAPAVLSKIRDTFEESDLPIKVDIVPIQELLDAYRVGVMKERVRL